MTREEMIEQLENTILLIKQNGKDWWDERDIPILEEAIKAMKMEPCKDVISRQAVLNKAKYRIVMQETRTGLIEKRGYFVDVDDIKASLRVLPKQKVGKWIPMGLVDANDNRDYECSECHHGDTHAKNQIVPYCWFCGAKMVEPQESEDKE